MDVVRRAYNWLKGTSIVYLYFVQEGVNYKAFHAIIYPLFAQYLNLPGHQYQSIKSLVSLAWSMKMFFSFFSDSLPILGYRRIPYITIGLMTMVGSQLLLSVLPMPDAYYQVSINETSGECHRLFKEEPQNPDAPNQAIYYIGIFLVWYMGLACADASVDGLMTQRSKLEPEESRGTLISYTRISGQVGGVVAMIMTGFLLNSIEYGGTFCTFGLPMNRVTLIILAITLSGVLYAFVWTNERDVDDKDQKVAFKERLQLFWNLLHQSNYLKLLIFCLIITVQWTMKTPANVKVQKNWAKVEPLTSNIVSIITSVLAGLGMVLYIKYLLNFNWRYVLVINCLFNLAMEIPVVAMTVFGVFRNQYFWFADDLIESLNRFWFVYIIELVIVEYAPNGIEGISYALIWAIMNIGRVIGTAVSNIIMSPFCLVDDERYTRDNGNDRWAVFYSFLIGYGFSLASICAIFLLPNQKAQAAAWREKAEQKQNQNRFLFRGFLIFCVIALIVATGLNCLTMFESTRCLVIAGGAGCGLLHGTETDFCILYN